METFPVLMTFCSENSLVTGEFNRTTASDAEFLCVFFSAPEPTVEQTMGKPVIWETIALIMTSL